MNLKIAFASATAMSVLMGAAWAGSNNKSDVIQSGNSNTALVQQNGSSNTAGISDYGGKPYAVRQTGSNNSIDIQQNGNGNRIGAGNSLYDSAASSMGLPANLEDRRPTDGVRNIGLNQIGNHNDFVLRQTETNYPYGNGNAVVAVRQQSSDSATKTTNTLSITQGNNSGWSNQFVGDVYQNNTSAGTDENLKNSMTIKQSGGGYTLGNRAFILTQDGYANTMGVTQSGTRNIVSRASQDGNGHEATVDQSGADNWLNKLRQDGVNQFASVSQTGTGNIVTQVDQSGDGHSTILSISGTGNGVLNLTNGAGWVGAPDNGVTQRGSGNAINMTISNMASNNSFGFLQEGVSNDATGITITGNDNQLGVSQVGASNGFALSEISGNGNNIGLAQTGASNLATINISGSFNGAGTFSGNASAVAGGRPSGLIVQGTAPLHGLNKVALTISSNSNQFSLYQNGSSNNITGSISGTSANQVAVAQNGNGNMASFSQAGGSNNIGISQ